ncbi:MAG TPA: hypothetical protein VMU01_01105 [Rhizomicrobium sp.]|nr:hypothetical protein [Rhizomicrobium sp.]
MTNGTSAIVVAVLATVFFAVYGFILLVLPHRLRDRHAHPQSPGGVIALRLFGVLMLLLTGVVIWAATEAAR